MAIKHVATPTEDAAQPSPWLETRTRYPDDMRLRAAGFRIHARPKDGEPIWTKSGILFSHRDALKRLETSEGQS